MNTVTTPVVDSSLLSTMNGNKAAKTTAQESQDRFMTLLVTQMKNQDPLNPLDNAQVTSQLAQLSTVTGIDKLNNTVAAMSASFQSAQNLQATNMIGHGVIAPGANLELKDGKSIFGFELPQASENLQILIKDEAGVVVRTINGGVTPAGLNTSTWDGKTDKGAVAKNGNYQFEVKANAADKKLDVTTLSFGLVSSIAYSNQGVKLSVANLGDVAMADVRQVF